MLSEHTQVRIQLDSKLQGNFWNLVSWKTRKSEARLAFLNLFYSSADAFNEANLHIKTCQIVRQLRHFRLPSSCWIRFVIVFATLANAKRTEISYVHWIKRYIVFHGKRHPKEVGKPEMEAFLTVLAVHAMLLLPPRIWPCRPFSILPRLPQSCCPCSRVLWNFTFGQRSIARLRLTWLSAR